MSRAPTYEELQQRIRALENEALEREQIEEALRHSEERYRDLYENAPNAYFSISPADGAILRCNATALRLLGYERETLMQMKVFDLYAPTPHGQPKANEVFNRFREGESIRDVELQMKRVDGEPIWVNISVDPVKDHYEKIVESRSMVLDLSKRKQTEEELKKKTHDLGERIKELNCLYGISHLREKPGISLEEMLQGVVDLLPPSWQFPEITCARVMLEGEEYKTVYFKETRWKQTSDILVHGKTVGSVEIFYLEEKPESDEGPFLKEERTLISAVAERLGKAIQHMRAEEALQKAHDDLERRVEERTAELRRLSLQLLNAQEEERKRIALELHDGIGQNLSAIKYRVENALEEMRQRKPGNEVKSLEPVVSVVQDAVEEVRRISMNLRPSILDDLGILATISWFCREIEETFSGIRIENRINIDENDVPDSLRIVIYRLLQEALNNMAKHSQANLVHLSLERTSEGIELSIKDNGVGFDIERLLSKDRAKRGLGLASMKERTKLSNGSFLIESQKDVGTTIQASWSLGGSGV